MSGFDAADVRYMARALELARRGRYTAHPNPRVGCVLVSGSVVVGEGWHRRAGEAHAEIHALDEAGEAARDSTAYVSLEPCSHHGKTPPCADALVAAGVARVVVAMEDPNPKVSGAGIAALEAAGIDVRVGLLRERAAALNEGFVSRVTRSRPFMRLKVAASLDGRTAMSSGESQWITGDAARRDVQRLRGMSGAILTGVGTVLADDPSLTVRDPSVDTDGRQPLRAVFDSRLRTSPAARLVKADGQAIIYCADGGNTGPLENAGAIVVRCGAGNMVDSLAALEDLADRGVNEVLVEAGPALAGSLLGAGLVDELVIYQAPHIMGSETRGMVTTPGWETLEQRLSLEVTGIRRFGTDIRITARPAG